MEDEEDYLYWFWYHPADGILERVDQGTHTEWAHYHMGFGDSGEIPDMADNDTLKQAIAAGWVRGRYGKRSIDPDYGYAYWRDDVTGELSLQGLPKEVLKTARFIATRWHYSSLYVDFASGDDVHEDMDGTTSVHLKGDRLEFFLKRGSIPSQMVQESKIQRMPFRDYIGNSIDLRLYWNPSVIQIKNLCERSKDMQLRYILVGNDLVAWDAYYVEHKDIAKLVMAETPVGRKSYGFFTMAHGKVTISGSQPTHPQVAKFLSSGFIPSTGMMHAIELIG